MPPGAHLPDFPKKTGTCLCVCANGGICQLLAQNLPQHGVRAWLLYPLPIDLRLQVPRSPGLGDSHGEDWASPTPAEWVPAPWAPAYRVISGGGGHSLCSGRPFSGDGHFLLFFLARCLCFRAWSSRAQGGIWGAPGLPGQVGTEWGLSSQSLIVPGKSPTRKKSGPFGSRRSSAIGIENIQEVQEKRWVERAAGTGLSPLTPIQRQSRAGRRGCLPSARLSLPGDSCTLKFLLCARHHASSSPNVKCFHLLSSSAGSLGSHLALQDAVGQRARGLPSSHSQWGAELGFSASLWGSVSTSVRAAVGSRPYSQHGSSWEAEDSSWV